MGNPKYEQLSNPAASAAGDGGQSDPAASAARASPTGSSPRIAHATFIIGGAAVLVPWTAYISSVDYFMMLVPGASIQYLLGVINMVMTFGTSLALVMLSNRCSARARVLVSAVVLALATAVIPVMNVVMVIMPGDAGGAASPSGTASPSAPSSKHAHLSGDGVAGHHDPHHPHHAYAGNNGSSSSSSSGSSGMSMAAAATQQQAMLWLILGSLCFCAAFGATMQSSLYGLAGELSEAGELTVSGEVGKAVSGVGIVAVRIISKAAFANDLTGQAYSTICFFSFGLLVIVASVISFIVMFNNPIMQQRMKRTARPDDPEAGGPPAAAADASGGGGKPSGQIRRVFAQVWRQACTACVVFLTCLACFPGLTSSIKSTTLNLGNWFPIIMIAMYNTGDLVGKTLPQYYCLFRGGNRPNRLLPVAGLLHLSFVPLFILRLYFDGLGDWFALILTLMLGIMTGYIGCSAMMLGPEQVERAEERETAGLIDSTFLILGLALGSLVGMGIEAAVGTRAGA